MAAAVGGVKELSVQDNRSRESLNRCKTADLCPKVAAVVFADITDLAIADLAICKSPKHGAKSGSFVLNTFESTSHLPLASRQ